MYYLARVVATESGKHTFLKIVRWKILISKRTCIVIRKSRPFLPSYSRRGLVQFRNCLILRMFWLFIPIPSDCLTKHSVRLSPPIKSKLSPDCSLDWPRVIGQHGQRRNHFSLHLYHHRHIRNEKCVPQLFLGSLLGTRRSAIGQFFPLRSVTTPEVFAKINWAQFPSRF